MFYRPSIKNARLNVNAGKWPCMGARIYLLILGSMMLICELIVIRHEVRGFYVEVLREVNTFFYMQKPPFGF